MREEGKREKKKRRNRRKRRRGKEEERKKKNQRKQSHSISKTKICLNRSLYLLKLILPEKVSPA